MRCFVDELSVASAQSFWQFFLVKAGPVSFYVALMPKSPYQKALDAFFEVTAVNCREPQWPLVYIYESIALLDTCQEEGFTMSEGQAKAKLSDSGLLLNWDPVRGLIKYFDAKTGQGIFVARNLTSLPSWEWFSPIKEFIHCWALQKGAWLAHAATIGCKDGSAMLLVGPGGSGKSTTCARMILSGNQTCGDDYVLMAFDGDQVVTHAIYRTVKLMPNQNLITKNGILEDLKCVSIAETGKWVYYLERTGREAPMVEQLSINSVCGLELDDCQTEPLQFGVLGYPHFAMSSLGQIPVWLDKSMTISREMFEALPKSFVRVRRDDSGLDHLLSYLTSDSQ